MVSRPENEAFVAKAREMHEAGKSISFIAGALGFAPVTINRWVDTECHNRFLDYAKNRRNGKSLSHKERRSRAAGMAALVKEGAKYRDVAEIYGVSLALVAKAAKDHGASTSAIMKG